MYKMIRLTIRLAITIKMHYCVHVFISCMIAVYRMHILLIFHWHFAVHLTAVFHLYCHVHEVIHCKCCHLLHVLICAMCWFCHRAICTALM